MNKSKLPGVGTSVFTVVSKMAKDNNAINLAQGFPNFPVDSTLIDTINEISNNDIHQYCPMQGLEQLRDKIRNIIFSQYRRNLNIQNILVTAGATQGIYTCIQALVKKNEEVIILDPSYDCYEVPVLLCDAKPIRIKLNDSFLPDWDKIEEAFNSKTRMIIINTPHNPSGRNWSLSDFEKLEEIMNKFPNSLVLSDEVYEFISFEKKHISVHQRKNLHEKCISVSSFGKTLHITGWKIGYLVASDKIMNEILKVHQYLVFAVNSIAQHALNSYLNKVNPINIKDLYQKKRDLFSSQMKNSRFRLMPCDGTYFQLACYDEISSKSDTEFVEHIIKEHNVAAIPVSGFYKNMDDNKMIRFCFAKDDATLINATELLCKI